MGSIHALQNICIRSVSGLRRCAVSSSLVKDQHQHQHQRHSTCLGNSVMHSAVGDQKGQCTRADNTLPKPREVLQFWLGDNYAEAKANSFPAVQKKLWFLGGPEVDKEMTDRFGALLKHAAETGLSHWNRSYNGLAAVLLMDQFSRNIYRGTPRMFALDSAAVDKATTLTTNGDAAALPAMHQVWLIFPFMHSEKLEDQHRGVSLVQQMIEGCKDLEGADEVKNHLQQTLRFAESHLKVIKDWGRFPHRNQVLGRPDTPEEQKGMADGSIPKFG